MMKKTYIHPTLEVMPFRAMNALCGSDETNETINTGNGGNPWTGGMAPYRRTPVF